MLLAVDAGNTNTVFAIYDGAEQRGLWRAATDTRRTADEHFVWLNQLMGLNGIDQEDIKAAIISTVVPASLFNLTRMCQRYFDTDAIVVGDPGVTLGIEVKLDNPGEVGADRLVNAVAAKSEYGGPLILIDFGTATTFDVIDRDGDYVGGVIAPGANLSMEALHMAAAKLPLVAVRQPHLRQHHEHRDGGHGLRRCARDCSCGPGTGGAFNLRLRQRRAAFSRT